MYELRVITRFAAAHQLRMVTEKCENLHGHNWKVELCVAGEKLQDSGVLVDFGIIKQRLGDIVETLDHRFLNELPEFERSNPSSELIAKYIADAFSERISADENIFVSRVRVWESDDACATYRPPRRASSSS
ncbi:MAG: 6-carboxytetrahydropterin synthase QueD [Desulfobacteraceae bacterium]|nr:6-carboxytetrahydropterin synthase QueD [Desulfobacteraceae bacterium]